MQSLYPFKEPNTRAVVADSLRTNVSVLNLCPPTTSTKLINMRASVAIFSRTRRLKKLMRVVLYPLFYQIFVISYKYCIRIILETRPRTSLLFLFSRTTNRLLTFKDNVRFYEILLLVFAAPWSKKWSKIRLDDFAEYCRFTICTLKMLDTQRFFEVFFVFRPRSSFYVYHTSRTNT